MENQDVRLNDYHKLYLPRQKLTLKEMLIFHKIVCFAFNILIPVNFRLMEAPLKLSFDSHEASTSYFFQYSPHPQILLLR